MFVTARALRVSPHRACTELSGIPGEHNMQYRLNLACPVKWTATQESFITRELSAAEVAPESAADYITRTYRQALWLPEVRVSFVTLSLEALLLIRYYYT